MIKKRSEYPVGVIGEASSCDLKANGSVFAKYRLNFSVVNQWWINGESMGAEIREDTSSQDKSTINYDLGKRK